MVPGDDISVPGMDDQQVDALVDRVDGNLPRVTDEKTDEAPAPPESFEFTHNGKQVKATRDELIKWAQMGYDRPQWQQGFNAERQKFAQERTQWENQRKQTESQWEQHRQIEQWAQSNPDKWNSVVQAFKNQGQSSTQAAASAQALNPDQIRQIIQSELQKNPLVSEVLTEHQQAKLRQEDSALDNAIKSVRDQYKDIDFNALNDQGVSLEKQILAHAVENGIKRFDTAFKDYCHQQLLDRAVAQAKQAVTRTTQAQTKLGILGSSPSSKAASRFSAPKNIRETSYEDLAREGLEEFRAATSR